MKRFVAVAVLGCLILAVSVGLSRIGAADALRDYRQDMRDFVQGISAYAKQLSPNFLVIPQNGNNLLTYGGPTGPVASTYLAAIDGVGQEDLFYGYYSDNRPTSWYKRTAIMRYLDIARNCGKPVLVTDYCWTPSYVDNSYSQNALKGYQSFAADHRELDTIPVYPATPNNINSLDITSLAQAQNFLYLIDPGRFTSKAAFLDAIGHTSYDVVLIDFFFDRWHPLTAADVDSIRTKACGGRRLVIAYMSIGEAEKSRDYWQAGWTAGNPVWLDAEDGDWPGCFAVHYWDKEWQDIVYGNDESYLKRILGAGFDGVYLDGIDAFEYYTGF